MRVADVSVTQANSPNETAQAGNPVLKIIVRNQEAAGAVVLVGENEEASAIRKVFTTYEEVPEPYIIGEEAAEILYMDRQTTSVPLGIKARNGENLSVTFEGSGNFAYVHLLDTKENRIVTQEELAASYSFVHDASFNDRFSVVFTRPTEINTFDNAFSISCKDNRIDIVTSPLNLIRSIRIYNPLGQVITRKEDLSSASFSCVVNEKGIYIIDVQTQNARIVKKLINN
jgi:hypothetical protein